MQLDDDATQGAPQGEAARQPAIKQAPDTGAEQNPSPESQEASPPGPETSVEPEKPKQTPWFQRRIDDLTRERWEARREADRLQAELATLRQPRQEGQSDPVQQGLTQADVQRLAREEAGRIAATNEFNANCNGIFEQGNKAFPDFEASLGNFRLLGGLPPSLVEAAIEAGEPAKVLYELGKNPDEAARILALSPTRMAVAVAKIAAKPASPPPVSKAPPPIKSIVGSGRVETDPDKMSTAEWTKWREGQLSR